MPNKALIMEEIESLSEQELDKILSLIRLIKNKPRLTTQELFADLRGKVTYLEDLTTPTTDEWQLL
ncbi:MAG: prevent-host-death protein [Dolichospermum sp.]